ncbi:MAG: repressor LexA [Clostridia bacterium]|nr:repressor LexA [Clostridia bacterium]
MTMPKPNTEGIIIDYVNEFYDRYLRSPSLREIEAETGLSRQTSMRYLKRMNEEGILKYDGKLGTIVTDYIEKRISNKFKELNIIGKIACGNPVTEEESRIGTIDFPIALLGSGEYFVLQAYGDSMIDAGIEENDLVIVKRQSSAEYGKIIVAIDENNENTLKRFLYDEKKKRPYLHPENKKYKDIYSDEINIQGVAVKVIKNLEG